MRTPPIPAAQYIRVSTLGQLSSLEIQRNAIEQYADCWGFLITHTFSDLGKRGNTIRGRLGFQKLIYEVITGKATYRAVLVYDVARWGRFLDTDEAGHYEFICRQAGVPVYFCSELSQPPRSPTLVSSIVRTLKRAAAGEYSRELSRKCFIGQKRIAELGFLVGGSAPYGMRRMAVSRDGSRKMILERGMHKGISTDRVVLVPGPKSEIAVVREAFHRLIDLGQSPHAIANEFNRREVQTAKCTRWQSNTVSQMLTNRKYCGCNVWNRSSCRRSSPVANPMPTWVTADKAFPAVIREERFAKAQEVIKALKQRTSDNHLLENLRRLSARNKKITGALIDSTGGVASTQTYRSHFGGLLRAYDRIGYKPKVSTVNSQIARARRAIFLDQIVNHLKATYGSGLTTSSATTKSGLLVKFSNGLEIAVRVCSRVKINKTVSVWKRFSNAIANDRLYLLCLLDERNERIEKLFLLQRTIRCVVPLHFELGDLSHGVQLTLGELTNLKQLVATLNPHNLRSQS
jgi:DNA invertase Pin-like site-specific DNA recombinase